MRQFTGLEYLFINLANNLGFDKEDWDERLEIGQAVYHNNINREEILETGKEAILAAKTVRAIDAAYKGEPCNIPVMFDATASGLQILAVLSGCPDTAENVNLINVNGCQCAYNNMAETMSKFVGKRLERSVIKPPTMTFFYASTAEPQKVFGKDTHELEMFYTTLAEEFPGATDLMYLMLSFWNSKALYHQWTLPDGHVAHVPVLDKFQTKVEINELEGTTFTYQFTDNTTSTYNKPMPANIVQSIDGYVVRELRRRCNFPILSIHDCFAVLPNRVNELRYHYLKIFKELADSNLLDTIAREVSGKFIRTRKRTSKLSTLMKTAEYHIC
ncbi:MAG: putative RNA polymerase [Prokaryotic dsDNA virus sp.]|nr:MAG: putative RNA polymerase [Prokaryotic dsDNA virus sp.]|tara:strand:- start:574 stop:1563 length:990 start_codon:yes stop_codon:yes gene_type:complete